MKTIKNNTSKSDSPINKNSSSRTEDRIKIFANLIVDRLLEKYASELPVSISDKHE